MRGSGDLWDHTPGFAGQLLAWRTEAVFMQPRAWSVCSQTGLECCGALGWDDQGSLSPSQADVPGAPTFGLD